MQIYFLFKFALVCTHFDRTHELLTLLKAVNLSKSI